MLRLLVAALVVGSALASGPAGEVYGGRPGTDGGRLGTDGGGAARPVEDAVYLLAPIKSVQVASSNSKIELLKTLEPAVKLHRLQ